MPHYTFFDGRSLPCQPEYYMHELTVYVALARSAGTCSVVDREAFLYRIQFWYPGCNMYRSVLALLNICFSLPRVMALVSGLIDCVHSMFSDELGRLPQDQVHLLVKSLECRRHNPNQRRAVVAFPFVLTSNKANAANYAMSQERDCDTAWDFAGVYGGH